MYWANFLHFYQPASQTSEILAEITRESYQKLIRILKDHPWARTSVNIAPTLTCLWAKYGFKKEISDLTCLAERGQIEFVATAFSHAFLPLLPEAEIARQIKLGLVTNKKYFGKNYRPQGFFPPEAGYAPKVAKVAAALGFRWLLLDEIAFSGRLGQIPHDRIFIHQENPDLALFFAERAPSYIGIMRGKFKKSQDLVRAMRARLHYKNYLLTATDAEIYGYHRPGQENFLRQVFKKRRFSLVTISRLLALFPKRQPVLPRPSSWSTLPADLKRDIPYPFWDYPRSPVHPSLKELLNLAIKVVACQKSRKARKLLDQALASDAFWWGSGYRSWWSPGLIEAGAFALLSAIKAVPNISFEKAKKAQDLYKETVLSMLEWEYSGKVEKTAHKALTRIGIFRKKLERKLWEDITP